MPGQARENAHRSEPRGVSGPYTTAATNTAAHGTEKQQQINNKGPRRTMGEQY